MNGRALVGGSCAVALALLIPQSALSNPKPTLYDFASRFLGHRLGRLTTSQLEAILGPGHVAIGAHSNSGRRWKLPNGAWLSTDGFDVQGFQILIDTIDLSGRTGSLASTFPARAKVGLLKTLRWQESKPQVEATFKKLERRKSQTWVYNQSNALFIDFSARKRGTLMPYQMKLQFSKNRLTSIRWFEKPRFWESAP